VNQVDTESPPEGIGQFAAGVTAAYPPAGAAARMAAHGVDSLAVLLFAAGAYFAVGWLDLFVMPDDGPAAFDRWARYVTGIGGVPFLLACLWIYFVLGIGTAGATPGMRLFRLRALAKSGEPIGISRAFRRWTSSGVNWLFFGLGHLVLFVRKDRRSLPDIFSGTKIVFSAATHGRWEFGAAALAIVPICFQLGWIASLPPGTLDEGSLGDAKIGWTIGHLGTVRSGLAIYYGDNNGQWPSRLDDPPEADLRAFGHTPSNAVEMRPFLDAKGAVDRAALRDTGGWLYDSKSGTLIVDCTHRDRGGRRVWLW